MWNRKTQPRALIDKAVTRLAPRLANALDAFLETHEDETFYAFAFDFDPGCACVYLSANTQPLFEQTLLQYQAGPSGHHYHAEARIQSLRYSPGDWAYAAFEELEVLSQAECDKIPESWSTFENDLIEALSEQLVRFRRTDAFTRLRKTPDFISFCISHDEHYTEALARMHRIAP